MECFNKNGRSVMIVFVTLGLVVQCTAQNPEVNITLGTLVGVTEEVPVDVTGNTTRTVNKFLGIRFAKPPVGDLRFSKPVAVDSQDNPYDATHFRSFCPQSVSFANAGFDESEDCLYLNVFVPNSTAEEATGHAVMVWIHGGAFIMGLANSHNGSPLAAVGNVIVVTLNYRLNALGFLSTYDNVAPGNYGLHDQLLAIRWVQDNIGAFGGDKDRVTIFGESAGAMSASLHGLNPDNHGLFQRIIAESGTATTELGFSVNRLSDTITLASDLGCPIDENVEMIACLRNVTLEDLKGNLTTEFTPIVDGDVVKYDYQKLSKYSAEAMFFQSLDFLTGVNAYEGGLMSKYIAGVTEFNSFLPTRDQFYTELIPTIQNVGEFSKLGENTKKVIRHEYTDWTAPYAPETIRLQYTKIVGDILFVVPAQETSDIHATTNKTYMYHYLPVTSASFDLSPTWLPGADHGAEIFAVFGYYLLSDTAPEWEKQLSMTMMTYWSNFAKSGSPNSPVPVAIEWPAYDVTSQDYMELDRDMGNHSTKQYLGTHETEFWRDVLPAVMKTENRKNDVGCDVTNGADHQLYTFSSLVCALVLRAVLL